MKTVAAQFISFALLIGGGVLMIDGIRATNSLRSDLLMFFSGSGTNRGGWMLLGGSCAMVAGLAMILWERRRG